MTTNSTKIVLCLVILIGLCMNETQAQVTFETGKIGVRLSNAGSIRLYSPSTTGTRQLERVNLIAALSEKAVSDYNENHDQTAPAILLASPTVADIEAVAVCNSNYPPIQPPNVDFKVHVYAWNNEPYIIARYTIINSESEQGTFYIGAVFLPRIGGNYGGESDKYDAEHKVAYCYREGETPHAGVRLLSGEPFSYHALDWSVYSPADPNSDAATDSTRYHMTADPNFDSTLVAGGDGSLASLNAGAFTLAPGDSVIVTYAIAFAETDVDLQAATDAAKAKYDVLVSVPKDKNGQVPADFSLSQNFPNPFNPATNIQFNLLQRSDVRLTVYNLHGQLVRTIASGEFDAGSHEASWDGLDEQGDAVGSGIYVYRLTAGQTDISKKMLLVR